MKPPSVALFALSSLLTLASASPTELVSAPIAPPITVPKPVTPPAVAKPATPAIPPAAAKPAIPAIPPAAAKPAALTAPLPVAKPANPAIPAVVPPRISSVDTANPSVVLTSMRSTLVEIRKQTSAINTTINFTGPLDAAKKAACIASIRISVGAICTSLAQLNLDCIGHWSDSITDVARLRQDLLNTALELVWEIVFSLRAALTRLQCSIYELLGSLVFVLLSVLAQLFCILNVWVDGFLKLIIGYLNSQIGLLTSVFSGLLTYVVDIAGGLFAQLTKLLACLLG